MTIQRYHTATRFSQICVHGGTVYLAGQVPDVVEGRDCADQARQVFAKVDALLAEAGSHKSNLLQVTVWLTDMADYDGFNEQWDAWLVAGPTPTRACIQTRLARSGWRVEVLAIAALCTNNSDLQRA
ncbi:MAG TPA: RidA family protein [Steroidobacter sp.]